MTVWWHVNLHSASPVSLMKMKMTVDHITAGIKLTNGICNYCVSETSFVILFTWSHATQHNTTEHNMPLYAERIMASYFCAIEMDFCGTRKCSDTTGKFKISQNLRLNLVNIRTSFCKEQHYCHGYNNTHSVQVVAWCDNVCVKCVFCRSFHHSLIPAWILLLLS